MIHNLIDAETINRKAAEKIEENLDSQNFNIVTVGRVSHEKGMDLTVLACAKLVADGYDDVRWWIVGDGSAMQEVLRTIRECRMEDYVITVGMKDNPYPYIRQANLYVQPSRIESFGLTIAEALMIGKPVVSTDTYGARELCKRYCNFTLCKIDEISLAQEVERLILLPNANNKGDDLLITKVEKENINAMRMLESIL